MRIRQSRWARSLALVVLPAIVAGCALPRSGPTKAEIFEGSVQRQGDAFVVSVNERVTRATAVVPALGFPGSFNAAGLVGSDTIRPGDTLGLTIYENVEDGLLTDRGLNSTILEEVQVDGAGFIFVPYAGRIRAAGNSPEAIRRIITGKLDSQTPDPQVQVRRLAGNGATVSVVGGVGAQGVYPIERPTRTLSAMLARAGGIAIPSEVAQVTLIRGRETGRIWFEDLYQDPTVDIALRDNDRIIIEQDNRSFTALGATGTQSRVDFEDRTISAIEAIARVGGLNPALADPTGVFVFRNEPEEIAEQVLARDDLNGTQRMVYVLDLTAPTGMFEARDFLIRDGDTVYVTEAPYVTWTKTVSALSGTVNSADSFASFGAN
ncbi:polysaccharide biosynthesis/export family protein [Profundibacterium mesophilum]|uniref:Capsular polysaccharide biosynthesisexport protein n=1 Tax=Profundibacterium mesophilum KAUST100406-0324 TaxID=1037889 RepID=A0A921NPR6_9RHOB|nr:polysaccharide biosynthesis/export family protein [Profundibacterium mesophilum]KAF0675697.1 putative capsular polysaccharide biosynthesisexport protein [Profundibacterium mesophilum KAUST100406-0324]